MSNNVPFVVPGLSTSSSTTPTPASSSSSSQDSVFDTSRYTENQYPKEAEVRVRSCEETRSMNKQKSKTQKKGREEVHSDLLHDLPDWLQDFREILVHASSLSESRRNPSHEYLDTSSSSHEFPMESRAKVELGSGVSIAFVLTSRKTQIVIPA